MPFSDHRGPDGHHSEERQQVERTVRFPLRVACVDMGSNAIRFLAAEFTGLNTWEALASERRPVRLGQGVHLSGRLDPSASPFWAASPPPSPAPGPPRRHHTPTARAARMSTMVTRLKVRREKSMDVTGWDVIDHPARKLTNPVRNRS